MFFWVGGTGTWDASNTSNWAGSSGGIGGVGIPSSSDDVFFDGNSGGGVVTIDVAECFNLDFTNFTDTIDGTGTLDIYGNLTMYSGMTNDYTGLISFLSTSNQTILSDGIPFASAMVFKGSGGIWDLQDDLINTGDINLSNGTLNLSNFDIISSRLQSNTTLPRVINMGSGTWTLTGDTVVLDFSNPGKLTFNADTSTIKLTDTSVTDKTVYTGDKSFFNYWNDTTDGDCYLIGTSDFADFKLSQGVVQVFDSGSTTTIANLVAIGSIGNTITMRSNNQGSQWTLDGMTGVFDAYYCSIEDSNATNGTFTAFNSIDVGNNNGWVFRTLSSGDFLLVFEFE